MWTFVPAPDMYGVQSDHLEEPVPDHDDREVDELLARSAPPVITSPQVHRELSALVRAAATSPSVVQGRDRRTGRRLAVGAGAAAVVFAGVSVAAASPSAPAWIAWADWTPDATVSEPPGMCDTLGLKVVPDRAGPDDPGVVAATRYLTGLRLDDVDYSEELVEQRQMLVTLEDGVTQVLGEDFRSDAELEYHAFYSAVTEMVFDEVRRQGLDASHVSIEGRADGCHPELPR